MSADGEGLTVLAGWGGTPRSSASVMRPRDEEAISEAVTHAGPRGILARGAGRAYGDAAMNAGGTILDLGNLNRLTIAGDRVTVGAGARLTDVVETLLDAGYFVPVSPGTSHVTMGGLVAADVHGKNHHRAGSWGQHIDGLRLVDGLGRSRDLSPAGDDADAFWATVGGMGLTGVVTEITFRAIPVTSAQMTVSTLPYADLNGVMQGLRAADDAATYSVAWIDSVGIGGRLGRGIVSMGEHAEGPSPSTRRVPAHARASVPWQPPVNLLGRMSIGLFNEAWMRVSGRPRRSHAQSLRAFFYPLDGVNHWNRLYGRAGFIQYQIVVPDDAADVIQRILTELKDSGAPSFLTVLKRFGAANPAPLSFPQPGWTVALDLPAGNPRLAAALDRLDDVVLDAGGRHYLAKDSRVTRQRFARGYPRLAEWETTRSAMDPHGVFVSDLSRRLDLAVAR